LRFKKEDELIPFLGLSGDSDEGNGEFNAHVDLLHKKKWDTDFHRSSRI
jgi:hypothetical protein